MTEHLKNFGAGALALGGLAVSILLLGLAATYQWVGTTLGIVVLLVLAYFVGAAIRKDFKDFKEGDDGCL